MLKINNKFNYYTKYKEPSPEDYKTEEDFYIAKHSYKIYNMRYMSLFMDISNTVNSYKYKGSKNIELKVGNKVFIERWDGNGIHDEVKIINIVTSTSRALIKTNKGFFVFSKWNCNRDDIEFNWTCKGKRWEKKYQRWVDGSKYFIHEK